MPEEVITFRVTGTSQAVRNLKDLEQKITRRIVTASVRAGQKIQVTDARARCPRRSGKMAKNIRGSVDQDRKTGTVHGKVRAKPTKRQRQTGKAAFYAHMVIGGTKPHRIPKGEDDETYIRVGGRVFKVIEHPGSRPNDFMEVAGRATWRRALGAFAKRYREEINKATNQLPKNTA